MLINVKLVYEIPYFTRKTSNKTRPKLFGKCAFPQNFYTRKLVEITMFFAVKFFQNIQGLLFLIVQISFTA